MKARKPTVKRKAQAEHIGIARFRIMRDSIADLKHFILCQAERVIYYAKRIDEKLDLAVPSKRMAIVWGECDTIIGYEREVFGFDNPIPHGLTPIPKPIPKVMRATLCAEPEWVERGNSAQLRITVQRPCRNIKLRVCAPFTITQVLVGKMVQTMSYGDTVGVICVDGADPGTLITVEVTWRDRELP